MLKEINVNKTFYSIHTDSRTNTPYMSKISPYDLTKYHWARKVPNTHYIKIWEIFSPKGIKIVSFTIPINTDEEEEFKSVAEYLLSLDESAHLHCHIDRT